MNHLETGLLSEQRSGARGVPQTPVDRYWANHVVCATAFVTPHESQAYLEWRFESYPLFREFSGLYGCHEGEVILDYGCGPGNDLVGFALYSQARKVIGLDVSRKALDLAAQRLRVHGIGAERVELQLTGDAVDAIELEPDSIDFINCQGVLHHASRPERLLREFYRVLKPTGRAAVMVYNTHSVWMHLYLAYEKLIKQQAFPGQDAFSAFGKSVDGPDCPLARPYDPEEFLSLCREAGFCVEYRGGYLSRTELDSLQHSLQEALQDSRLPSRHRDFLGSLKFDARGFPLYGGFHAGIGGVYRLYAWDKAPRSERAQVRQAILDAELADVRAQVSQVEAHSASLQTRHDALQRRYVALESELQAVRRWRRLAMSVPGVRILARGLRWMLGGRDAG